MQFLAAPQIPVVAALPAASSAPQKLIVQAGVLWFSDGAQWVNLGQTITIGTTPPPSPTLNQLWLDTN